MKSTFLILALLTAVVEFPNYDTTRTVTIEGVITKVEIVERSSLIGLNVKDANGRPANWDIHGPTPVQLVNSGLRESLKSGARLKVTGFPPKSATASEAGRVLYGTTYTVADNRQFYLPR